MRNFRNAAMAAALAVAASACQSTAQIEPSDALDQPPVASHDFGYLDDLVRGRVFVHLPDLGRVVAATYVYPTAGPDGTIRSLFCWASERGSTSVTDETRWSHVPHWSRRAQINGRTPVYDPVTGAYSEYVTLETGRHELAATGWIQDSWPRILVNECPDLELPPDLPINEKQRDPSRFFDAIRRQDPDAPIRNFVSDAPAHRVQVSEYLQRLPAHDGEIVTRKLGNYPVQAAVFTRFSTVWHLRTSRTARRLTEQATERGWLKSVAWSAPHTISLAEVDRGTEVYRERWRRVRGEESGVAEWTLDDWIGFMPTGIRHPVAEYMDIMSARGAPAIRLPDRNGPRGATILVHFRDDLSASVIREGGSRLDGTWRLEERFIVVEAADGTSWRWPAIGFGRWLDEAGLLP